MKEMISPQYFTPDYSGFFGDARLAFRAMELSKKLYLNPSSKIRQLASNKAEQKAYYRLLNNDKVTEDDLIQECSSRMSRLSAGRDLLCIQDTCEISLASHKNRLKSYSGLGRSDNSETAHCFKLHPGLVLDAATYTPLGFSYIKLFDRHPHGLTKEQRNYPKLPIEQKESYKWIEVAHKSKQVLEQARSVTFIEDREGDIYEQFTRIADEKSHLLIRSRTTRRLSDGASLYTAVGDQPVSLTYTVELPTDNRKNQYKRSAEIELRFKKVEIKRPQKIDKTQYPEKSIHLTCIWVKEKGDVSNPIDWKLLTTHQIESKEKALLMVEWYGTRWYIEQLFRILKKQGFGIESAELENGWAIRKLVIMQMNALLKILQMNIAYADPEQGQPIEEVFDPDQIDTLRLMNKKLQGKTKKLQNHNDPKRTKWAAWIIGRIGGWKGYDSQGPPGVIILKKGLDRLAYIQQGIQLVKNVGTL